jgi:small subunit ribosomal protein S1
MSGDFVEEKNNQEESFAELFESYSAGANENIQIGDKIKGKIISIGKDSVFIDTGTKIDGVVGKEELLDEKLELPYKEGDILELYVVENNGNEIRLSRALSGSGGLRMIYEAFQSAIPVEGKVKEECKGGFHVEIMKRRAFCPISQMDLRYVERPDDHVGETYLFLITKCEENGKNIVVSRREFLNKEQEKTRQQFFQDVAIGTQLEGRVTKLMPYGAFVEILPGIEGMVHISEISWSRVEKVDEVLKAGDSVTVQVIGMEEGKRPGERKLSLSMKQITGNPWDNVEDKFRIGDKIKGKVTRCVKFGAFVEIAPGIEGLVHISEMSYKRRVLKAEDVVMAGGTAEVMVKEIDIENRRISLSIKDAEGDPWIDIDNKFKVGQSVEGILEKKERFGYFVGLEPGITGLIPKSKADNTHKSKLIEKLREGDAITVFIEEINRDERKITLSPGDSEEEDNWKSYAKSPEKPVGSLAEKLQQALKSKKE